MAHPQDTSTHHDEYASRGRPVVEASGWAANRKLTDDALTDDALTDDALTDDNLTDDDPTGDDPTDRLADLRPLVRWDPGRHGRIALMAAGVIAVFGTVLVVALNRPTPFNAPAVAPVVNAKRFDSPPTTSSAPSSVVVSVVGRVHQAGLVTLPPNARVSDAISAAGGALEEADLWALNLAQPLEDGVQLLVAPAPEAGGNAPIGGSALMGGSGGASAGASGVTGTGAGTAATGGTGPGRAGAVTVKINLNTADAGELDTLPGVGPATAAAILAWRQQNGSFANVDQLGEVDGIGPSRFARLKDRVTV